jgi:hypothetical protein
MENCKFFNMCRQYEYLKTTQHTGLLSEEQATVFFSNIHTNVNIANFQRHATCLYVVPSTLKAVF